MTAASTVKQTETIFSCFDSVLNCVRTERSRKRKGMKNSDREVKEKDESQKRDDGMEARDKDDVDGREVKQAGDENSWRGRARIVEQAGERR